MTIAMLFPRELTCGLTRFNKIATQATAQMAADKEAVGLPRVQMYECMCILPALKVEPKRSLAHLCTCYYYISLHNNTEIYAQRA